MSAARKHAPWRLWILVIIWVFQYLFLALELVVLALAFALLGSCSSKGASESCLVGSWNLAAACVHMILTVFCLGLTVAEAVLLSKHTLSPLRYLLSNLTKTIIWLALFIASLVTTIRPSTPGSKPPTSQLLIAIAFLAIFAITLLHATILFLKTKARRVAAGEYGFNGLRRPQVAETDILMMEGQQGVEGSVERGPGYSLGYYAPYG